jgi:hypothetical protein
VEVHKKNMRRLTPATNGHLEKVAAYPHVLALYILLYIGTQKLRMTRAMQAGHRHDPPHLEDVTVSIDDALFPTKTRPYLKCAPLRFRLVPIEGGIKRPGSAVSPS